VRSGNRGCSARIATSIPAKRELHRKWAQNASDPTGEMHPPGGISSRASQVARTAAGTPMSSPAGFTPSRISQKTSKATKRGSKERAEAFTSAEQDENDSRRRD
jgi:hypothetical protein